MDRAVNRILRRSLCTSHLKQPYMLSANVRKTFIDYFEQDHHHMMIPSSPVMPYQDPTLSFVNAGMNQFKRVFLGEVTPASKRVVNSQKCIRVKGKHNDLFQVGLDGTHHTFFEMLGNWSFGDYFKKEGCALSWNLLTKVYKIPPERLYVTYFQGDESMNLAPDLETYEAWAEIGVPKERILPFGMKDNFWEMASTGPCGPCTEIHYDHVDGRTDAGSLVNSGSPEVTELWNLVFMEFNRTADDTLEKLNQHYVDTGMGFERLVAILQGQTSNYETDVFQPLFDAIRDRSGHSGYTAQYTGNEMDVAYRVLADHARMVTVALSDRMVPNIHNRVRTILRRAFLVSRNIFKVEKGLVKELSNYVAESLNPIYPEIGRRLDKVHYMIDEEEESFWKRNADATEKWLRVLAKYPEFSKIDVDMKEEFVNGLNYVEKNLLNRMVKEMTSENAWVLMDTYGIPLDIVQEMSKILNLKFSLPDFEKYRNQLLNKARSENETKYSKRYLRQQKIENELSAMGLKETKIVEDYEPVFDPDGNSWTEALETEIAAFIVGENVTDKVKLADLEKGRKVGVVFSNTNLCHELPEQMCDSGVFRYGTDNNFLIKKVVKIGKHIVHYGVFDDPDESAELSVGQAGTLTVDEKIRNSLVRSNTALHVMRALLDRYLKVFLETSALAGINAGCLSFSSYNEVLQSKDILVLEKETVNLIKDSISLEWRWCDLKEVLKMDDLITKPGQVFIEPRVRILEVTGPNFKARLPCSGFLLRSMSPLDDFLIIDLEKRGYRVREISFITGEKAVMSRKTNEYFLKDWNNIRDFHVTADDDVERIMLHVEKITLFVKNYASCKHLSQYIKKALKEETSAKLILLDKHIKRKQRDLRKVVKKLIR